MQLPLCWLLSASSAFSELKEGKRQDVRTGSRPGGPVAATWAAMCRPGPSAWSTSGTCEVTQDQGLLEVLWQNKSFVLSRNIRAWQEKERPLTLSQALARAILDKLCQVLGHRSTLNPLSLSIQVQNCQSSERRVVQIQWLCTTSETSRIHEGHSHANHRSAVQGCSRGVPLPSGLLRSLRISKLASLSLVQKLPVAAS